MGRQAPSQIRMIRGLSRLVPGPPQKPPCPGGTSRTLSIRGSRILVVKLVFVEAPAFARCRASYLDDLNFSQLQVALLQKPETGDVMPGTGGVRKLRWTDSRRGKGKRGGLRVLYLYLPGESEIWFFTLYRKGEVNDLTPREKALLKKAVDEELAQRQKRS